MIAREGLPFIAAGVGATGIVAFWVGWFGAVPAAVVTLFVVWFFRDPDRRIPADPDLVLSPADGRVLEVAGEGPRKISIFLSIFDVHVNRVPFSGRVKEVRYRPGRFRLAYAPKASADNEQNLVDLDGAGGREIRFVQIAGLVARRIVCRLRAGDLVERGERFGMIRFGSRMEVFLPSACEIRVAPGDRVRGGESVIGRFR